LTLPPLLFVTTSMLENNVIFIKEKPAPREA
jgi:hypothetical protein